VVVVEMNENLEKYNIHVKEWVETYASKAFYVNKIKCLVDMGFNEEESKKALIQTGYDE
jgi:uncharacterized UBP type Zn finger protein